MRASRSSAGGRHHVSRDAAITTTSGSSRARSAAVAAESLTSSRSNSTRCGPPSSSASSAACPVRARPCSSSRLAPTRRSSSGRRASESSTRVPRSPRPMTRAVAATGASYHGGVTEGATSVGGSTTRSAELFERARHVLVDGVSSPSRGPLNFTPYPLFMTGGEGGEIVDADGNRYVDLMLGFGALIHGHAHPRLVAALRDASGRGALLATASEIEVEVAERLIEMIPGAERIRFANTGTEACMAARRIADEHDVLLWIDETVTGFRLAAGGAQEQFGVHADLVTFGKALGAGFPVAALAGPAAVMDALAGGRVLHYGTQNANPALLAVVRESLNLLTPEAFAQLERLAEQLVAGLREAIADAGAAALVQNV